ncbi:MAG: lipid IV(A) 3-deoxy-D-manno-octulosonic acid transferase [gamma proteobacterium symbiont of Bathyaustriella thionipta]|nr:lipid IV(A) 3-deoxy-D-manno-octulosonic acid transferase [gamma proteobacterium symbiont of Bathyaustriella thionipta]
MSRKLYSLLLLLLLPFVLLRLFWRGRHNPDYRQRWRERLGFIPTVSGQPIWIHAVSVGEVQAIAALVQRLQQQGHAILMSTTTATGAERVRALFGDSLTQVYFPYDLSFVLQRFFSRAAVRAVIMVETEIWPNLVALCAQQQIPIVLANARLSARSARGYARFPRMTQATLEKFCLIAAQTEVHAQRFIKLGAQAGRVAVTGNLKFDLKMAAGLREQAVLLRHHWGKARPVWVAASTHETEEEILLNVHSRLLQTNKNALLILAPRHPERFDKVASLVKKTGFRFSRYSRCPESLDQQESIIVLDSMGKLAVFLAAADIAFIGGSLLPVGGHNALEAAVAGVPCVLGPHMFNFAQVSAQLQQQQAAIQISGRDELLAVLRNWFDNPDERLAAGVRARRFVVRQRGALDQLQARLAACL